MVAVIFEVWLKEGKADAYLAAAAELKKMLNEAPGLISVERFQSLAAQQKLLSLSFWQDEGAVATWRTSFAHRAAQQKGRKEIFEKYTLTVAQSLRQYTDTAREHAPEDSNNFHIYGSL